MTIEPSDFDMIDLARRGLQALLDEAIADYNQQFGASFGTDASGFE